MKRWENFVKDYLTFSKRERNGIFIVLLLGTAAYLAGRYFPIHHSYADKNAFQKELAQLKILVDTSTNSYAYHRPGFSPDYYHRKPADSDIPAETQLFVFDPNTLDAAGWKKLGVREKTITTIEHFIAKGYKFREPEDIKKIYGLRPADADRLVPYVRIADRRLTEKSTSDNHYTTFEKRPERENYKSKIIEINTADTSEFIALPGIGSKLAARIVNFREKLGGFNSVSQIGETYGIPDSTFQLIKPRLQCNSDAVRKININTSNAGDLKTHPYIKWNIANAIVNYRTQHGTFKSLDELRKIEIITDEIYNKIAPYLNL